MGKILSYNNKTTGEGWIPLNTQYNADEIEMISDPNGGLSQKPRTAIPSPFAQMDLVKNAFSRLASHSNLQGEAMDEKLVANALDIAQLFFSYPELKSQLHIIEWNRDVELSRLLSDPQHKLFGETLKMFLEQDKEAFNFDRMDRLYFLVYGNQVIGSTSPVTLFMASPNAEPHKIQLPVEQNVNLFDLWRPLHMRNEKFVMYIYALFTAYPELKRSCGEVNHYLITSFQMLSQGLRDAILKEIGNPEAMDMQAVEHAKGYLDANFQQMDEGVQVLGVPFYCVRQEDVLKAIENSDFVIVPTREVGERLPLVLQNHLNAPQTDPFRYITTAWSDATVITPADYAPEPDKRVLPATSHQYPWLTADDFFQPALIKLDYRMDGDCFFDGNLSIGSRETDDCDFVLPLKPLFFKYFNVSDLWGTVGGRPKFELIHTQTGSVESVKAILRVPVRKQGRYITLERTYVAAHNVDLGYDVKNDRGYFITVPFALSVFPFVHTQGLKQYNVQLVDRALGMLENYRLALDFYKNGYRNQVSDNDVVARERSLKSEKRVGSCYYKLAGDFDYINVSLTDERGNKVAEGVVCPKWPDYIPGHDAFTFAVDFGTTNTHVECMKGDDMPEPLKIDLAGRNRMLATLYNGSQVLYDVIIKQEFLPKEIGEDYGFPQRTVLSECERMDAVNVDNIVALGDADIPFIYEKESVGYGNRIVPNLKWSTEIATGKRIRAYLTEIALLLRTKVLLENGDMAKVRLVWFYPLSMKVGNIRKLGETWSKIFSEVFGIQATETNLIPMPESVAPYYFYKCSSQFRGAASTVASIDIGGGSSDVVVFESNAQQPAFLTSFRFAANVLFGDGFSEVPHGDTNPMLVRYVDYFRRLFDSDDDKYGELNGILDDITAKRKSEDINAFLFSVINNKVVNGNDVFSYNMRLNEDGDRKIVFVYFYVALIHYVACMMKHRGLTKPRSVMFSGTGSKVLDIVGSQRDLDLLTQAVFERVYGEQYDADGFSVVMEKNEPKQITCRGALMQVRDGMGCQHVAELNKLMDDFDSHLKYNYSMLPMETLRYEDMDREDVRAAIVRQVKEFNDFFLQLCEDIHIVDRFLVENRSLIKFRELVNKDLEHHLINGWNFVNKNQEDKNGSDPIEDTVFFYPIIGSIRDNLIEHLTD
ncbi:hypothetical protein [Prevotella sp. KH2C16]|uniref:hypothetical protein n=1 Tax=Prevotella sp. KH2C16 TaxID=1855325 RepID=UPI0008EDFC93|nr:hypothetical protein [Prevotella sp. KH2C16]SFG21672.1 hypothetical protein SAMN05216383_10766 [Prevotella sp. KH2C16]